jgi:hypothetical protein
MRWVGTDDFECVAPGRLRHSWLDNQVLLVLRRTHDSKLTCGRFLSIVSSWRDDVAELRRYAQTFPGVVDPGTFLRQFSENRSVAANESLCSALTEKFEAIFYIATNMSVGAFRGQLIPASDRLDVALGSLEADLGNLANGDIVPMEELSNLQEARQATMRVHELLGIAPRGVCLV